MSDVFEERFFCDLWSPVHHYRLFHWIYFQMYFNYSSLLNFWREILWSLITSLLLSDFSLIWFSDVSLFLYWFIFSISFEGISCDLWSLAYHYRIYHYLDSQMYFNYSSLLIHLLVSLKKGFVIFDQLFITIGFITEFILRCIYNDFLLTL